MFNNNLLMGAASAGGTSLVSVGNSALFDASASTDGLSYTTDGSGFNQQTFTLSTWFYLGSNTSSIGGVGWPIFASDHGSANSETTWWKVRINTNGTLVISNWNDVTTTQVFRDIGWYNLVIAADTTQAIASNRYRVYVNGERITSFSSTGYPSQNIDLAWGEPSEDHWIGNYDNANYAYNGYLAETVFKSGSQLGPESFGEFDSTGTFWTPLSSTAILASSPTFYLDNATNPQTDASGNGNNFTNNGSIATSTHTPTNIEFLMSPINVTDPSDNPVLSNGNRTYTASSASAQTRMGGNIPFPSSGKWLQGVSLSTKDNGKAFAVWTDRTDGDGFPNFGGFLGWHLTTVMNGYNSSGSSPFSLESNFTTSDQFWIAVDIDNSKVWLGFYDDSASTITWYAADGGTDGNPATGDNPFESIDCSGMVFAGAAQNSKAFTLVKEADCPFTIPTGYSFLSTTNLAANITRTHSNLEEYFGTTLYEGNGAGQRVGKFLPFTNAFTVGNSALFNTSNYLSRTPSSTGNAKTATFSRWIKRNTTGYLNILFSAVVSSSQKFFIVLNTDNQLELYNYSGAYDFQIETTRTFLDLSQWVHFYVAIDTSESTSADRIKVYINGVQETSFATASYPSLNFNMDFNTASVPNYLGFGDAAGGNVYSAETAWVDGTIYAPSYFGQVDTSTNRWIPKALAGITFGTNGFYQDYADSDNLGDDESGNGNDFTNNNTVVQSSDSPTVNFAVFDANFVQSGFVLSNGNQTADASSTNKWGTITLPITTGKWFGVATTTDANSRRFGVASNEEDFVNLGAGVIPTDDEYAWAVGLSNDTTIVARNNGTNLTGTIQTIDRTNDRYAVAIDCDNRKVWLGVYDNSAGNIQWVDSGGTVRTTDVPASGVNETYILTGTSWRFFAEHGDTGSAQTIDFGQSSFGGASLPSGFLGLNQDNMPTGESYLTAFSWIKNRDSTDNHMLFDRVRGIYNNLHSNTQDAEDTNVNTLQRFLNGGVQVGNDVQVNTASESYVAWNWYMETAGTGSSNTDGTINTTSTLVDTNLGLSISKYTGTGANATIGHGLGVVPEFFMVKILDTGGNDWMVYHSALGATKNLVLNKTTSFSTSITRWNNTEPTSSLISLGTTTAVNGSGSTYVCYAFAPSQFISIGSYNGNGNANGTFIPTVNSLGIPIQPAWFMARSTGSGQDWRIVDNKRNPSNVNNLHLRANTTAADTSETNLDIDTGGIKIRTSSGGWNTSGTEYIYLAFGTPIIDVDGRIITGF